MSITMQCPCPITSFQSGTAPADGILDDDREVYLYVADDEQEILFPDINSWYTPLNEAGEALDMESEIASGNVLRKYYVAHIGPYS